MDKNTRINLSLFILGILLKQFYITSLKSTEKCKKKKDPGTPFSIPAINMGNLRDAAGLKRDVEDNGASL